MRILAPFAYIVLYVLLYLAFGVASPFWPMFFETKALAPQQIGWILGASMLMRLGSGPLIARLADLLGSLRLVLATSAAFAAAAAVALLWADRFWTLLVVALVQAAALAPTTSIADALSVSVARPQIGGRPFEYGWIRGSASAAFVLGTLTVGYLIRPSDLSAVIWMNAAFLMAVSGAAASPPSEDGRAVLQVAPSRSAPVNEVNALLRMPRFRTAILVSALVYGRHAMHDSFAVIRWSDAGISAPAISILWSEAVVSEVLVFWLLGPALVDHFGTRFAAVLAAEFSAGRLRA